MDTKHQFRDLTGQVFGRLTVLEITKERRKRTVIWLCKCTCGNLTMVTTHQLTRSNKPTRSCGCLHSDRVKETHSYDLVDKRFGRLLVLESTQGRSQGSIVWKCLCDCGNTRLVSTSALLSGNTQSCGCYQKEQQKSAVTLPEGESAFNRLYRGYMSNAEQKHRPFLLTKDEFRKLTKGNCHYCGSEPKGMLTEAALNGTYNYNGIDRVDNTKGYMVDNCVPCCGRCNRAKDKMSQEEFLELIKNIYKNRNLGDRQDEPRKTQRLDSLS